MNAAEIKKVIEQYRNEYCYFGIRAMTGNPLTHESPTVEIDDIVENSWDWLDGDPTEEELEGTCALQVDPDDELEDIEHVLKEAEMYLWNAKQLVLLGCMYKEYGNDNNEIIMRDAIVLLTEEV